MTAKAWPDYSSIKLQPSVKQPITSYSTRLGRVFQHVFSHKQQLRYAPKISHLCAL